MSSPYYPSANPGGQNTRLVRAALKDWLDAQEIPGILEVFPSLRPQVDWDQVEFNSSTCLGIVYIHIPGSDETRAALTGPDNPGGKDIAHELELRVIHHGTEVDDWDEAQDDYDRIMDSLKDGLRARGRDLGRPDVILQAGETGGIQQRNAEPIFFDEEGKVDRTGSLFFIVEQYLPTFIPSAPQGG